MSGAYRSVPVFKDQEVDVVIQHFERVAKQLTWPQSKWALLAVLKFKGNANQYHLVKSDYYHLQYSELRKTQGQFILFWHHSY